MKEKSIYTVTATMTYNGEKYEASNNILVGGEIQPVITDVSVDEQDFGISNISTIESNGSYELSFISSNVIRLSAAITNAPGLSNEICWEIKSMNSHLTQTIVTNAPELAFMVGKPWHASYLHGSATNDGHGSRLRSLPLSYQIKAYYTLNNMQTNSFSVLIQQDERSILRQEFWNHSLFAAALHDPNIQVPIPNYNGFSSNICIIISNQTNFTFNELRKSINYYDWILIHERLTNGLTITRTAFNTNMDVSSIWRNPERDEAVGGVLNSCHMYGYAADIYVRDWNHNGNGDINTHTVSGTDIDSTWANVGDDWLILASTAKTNGQALYIEPYEDTGGWVHMDWWRVR